MKTKISIRNIREGYLLTLPLLLGCLVFYAVPYLLVLRGSVYAGVLGHAQQFAGLENYSSLLENTAFRLAFGNTMKFLAVALPAGEMGAIL